MGNKSVKPISALEMKTLHDNNEIEESKRAMINAEIKTLEAQVTNKNDESNLLIMSKLSLMYKMIGNMAQHNYIQKKILNKMYHNYRQQQIKIKHGSTCAFKIVPIKEETEKKIVDVENLTEKLVNDITEEEKSAEKFAQILVMVADKFLNTKDCTFKNEEYAMLCYEMAAQYGYKNIFFNLGNKCYEDGNMINALRYFLMEKNEQNDECAYMIGHIYDEKLGTECNKEKAIHYYTIASKNGNVKSQRKLTIIK
ncbi:MAG: hypothetical protein Edafosvirus2_9 [Edafosvirus sp.]|uniref:Sel1 repeat protein n=1 Tax=Edafosvirus sp. TaxID=2487765 RepID=A0A3G4ZSF2_9VIRU|nr:MAG: hypothetical protein Edafosvirus2_9 [Edafosvirus sp.]